MTESGYGCYEQKGKRKKNSLSMLQRLAHFYSMPITYFTDILEVDLVEDDTTAGVPGVMFVAVLKKLREEIKLTQEELATRVGVARTTIIGYEKGEREPSHATLVKLALALNCSLGYLLTGDHSDDAPRSLTDLRDQIAAGRVSGIPEDRLPFVLDAIDKELLVIKSRGE